MALLSYLCLAFPENENMELFETGVSLSISCWPKTVYFYRDILGLPVRQAGERWTTYRIGYGYLLVEQFGGVPERCQEQGRTFFAI
jgi:catechol-2,3-dioxygenase